MVKRVMLVCDDEMHYKMKRDKMKREKDLGMTLTWEGYVYLLFGISKSKNIQEYNIAQGILDEIK